MRLTPRSFLWRTILMILIPLVVALAIIANAFFGNHWSRVHDTLARTLAGEMTTMTNFIDEGNKILKNTRVYLSETFVSSYTFADGSMLEVGYYNFDAEGKMILN